MRALARERDVRARLRERRVSGPLLKARTPVIAPSQSVCACGGGCPRCQQKQSLQTKLAISQPGDTLEREADRFAEQVMRMPQTAAMDSPTGQGNVDRRISRYAQNSTAPAVDAVPPAVQDVLRAPGQPLDRETRSYFEPRFGSDLGHVRIHADARAGESAQAVNALAYTVGNNVVFRHGQYDPRTSNGKHLIAHELAHVMQQQRGAGGDAGGAVVQRLSSVRPGEFLFRFVASERDDIANLDAVIATAKRVAKARGALGMMRWGRFVAGMGGSGAIEAIAPSSGSTRGGQENRYLFTCRCGLIDMRHFYQLMYIALLQGNRAATEAGREHELHAEETSRFAPEDTPSNAMGALFGDQQSWIETQGTFLANLRTFLNYCQPVDFARLPASEQNAVVDFYSARAASGAPLHPNESALPAMGRIASCSGAGMFPFVLAGPDLERKTLSGVIDNP